MTTCDFCGRQEADEATTLTWTHRGRERPAAHLLRDLLARAPAGDGGQARQRVLVTGTRSADHARRPGAAAVRVAAPRRGVGRPRSGPSTTVADQVAGGSPSAYATTSRTAQASGQRARAPGRPAAPGSRPATCSTTSARRGSCSPRWASTQRRQAVTPGTTNGPTRAPPGRRGTSRCGRAGPDERVDVARAGARRRARPASTVGAAGRAADAGSPASPRQPAAAVRSGRAAVGRTRPAPRARAGGAAGRRTLRPRRGSTSAARRASAVQTRRRGGGRRGCERAAVGQVVEEARGPRARRAAPPASGGSMPTWRWWSSRRTTWRPGRRPVMQRESSHVRRAATGPVHGREPTRSSTGPAHQDERRRPTVSGAPS